MDEQKSNRLKQLLRGRLWYQWKGEIQKYFLIKYLHLHHKKIGLTLKESMIPEFVSFFLLRALSLRKKLTSKSVHEKPFAE